MCWESGWKNSDIYPEEIFHDKGDSILEVGHVKSKRNGRLSMLIRNVVYPALRI